MPRLRCSTLRTHQYQWISGLVILYAAACHDRLPHNNVPTQPSIKLVRKQHAGHLPAIAAPRSADRVPIRRQRKPVVYNAMPRHDVVLFADLQSPFFARQKMHLQQLLGLPLGTFDFHFYDWATPYHHRGIQLAMDVHEHSHPLKALLDIAIHGAVSDEPEALTSISSSHSIESASQTAIHSRHQHLGMALKMPAEIGWIIDGQIIDGTTPESLKVIGNTLRKMRPSHTELPPGTRASISPHLHTLRKRLAERWLDYQYGVWLSADLGPPAPELLYRYAHPTGANETSIPVRNSILVLGIPDDPSTQRAVAQAEQLGREVDAQVTWLKVAPYSNTDARRRVSLAYASEQDETDAYRLAQHYDIRRIPGFILDGIPSSAVASMSAIRAIWTRRATAHPGSRGLSNDAPRPAPAFHPLGTGPELTVFADTALETHRKVLQRLIGPAKRGEWTIHMHHLPGASYTSRTRAQTLHGLALVSTATEYWGSLLDARISSTPPTQHARTSLARDIAWSRRMVPQSSYSRNRHAPVHLLLHGRWVTIGLSAPDRVLLEYKDAMLSGSAQP